MINFEVSTLGFPLSRVRGMAGLPKDFGIEIFYEWGGTSFWIESLKNLMRDRTGSFSIHAPFGYCDFAQTESEVELFRFMMEPFDMYHQFNGSHFVVHTNGHINVDTSEQTRAEMRKLVAERLAKFQTICDREGIEMVVENVPDSGRTLFNHEHFLSLFMENPKLNCIIDTGHAHMEHLDMFEIQKALGHRLKAYHVHDNAGTTDSHLRFMSGISGGIDWKRFAEGVARFTPHATITFEYGMEAQAGVQEYMEDQKQLLKMMEEI